eukprot:339918-Prymnesium_polylepis.1
MVHAHTHTHRPGDTCRPACPDGAPRLPACPVVKSNFLVCSHPPRYGTPHERQHDPPVCIRREAR